MHLQCVQAVNLRLSSNRSRSTCERQIVNRTIARARLKPKRSRLIGGLKKDGRGGELGTELFWMARREGQAAGVWGDDLRVAELTVFKISQTSTIIRPERGGFCDYSVAGNK
jgi:hypothetical protein